MKSLAVLSGIAVLSGCVHLSGISKLDQLRPNEAIAIGRFTILLDGTDITKKSNLILTRADQPNGTTRYQSVLQHDPRRKETYILARLPAGKVALEQVISIPGLSAFSERHYKFNRGDVTFELPEPGHAYYIGDLTVEWSSANARRFTRDTAGSTVLLSAMFGPAGFLVGSMVRSGGDGVITMADDLPHAASVFEERFGGTLRLEKSLMTFGSAPTSGTN